MDIKAKVHIKKGLSLAELILTMTIVGSIASLTIPALVQDVQDKIYKTAWKRKYSQIEQVTRRIIAVNGSMDSFFTSSENLKIAFLAYMKYLRTKDNATSDGTCWHSANTWYYYNGTPQSGDWGSCIMSNDGSLIHIHVSGAVVAAGGYCAPGTSCGYMFVDVNGFSKPNTIGRDIYGIHFYSTYLKPRGAISTGYGNTCNPASTGWGCSMEYLRQ